MLVQATATYQGDQGGSWAVNVDGVDVVAQVSRLSEAPGRAAELALGAQGSYTHRDVEAVEVDLDVVVPDAADLIHQARQMRDAAATYQREATAAQRAAARALTDLGLTLTDVGYVLGVTRQRASQLVHDNHQEDRNGGQA